MRRRRRRIAWRVSHEDEHRFFRGMFVAGVIGGVMWVGITLLVWHFAS
jgi:hypothetical protein